MSEYLFDPLDEMNSEDLKGMGREELENRCLGLHRAYFSLQNAVNLYKRQLSAVRDHSLKTGQIADLSRKVNIIDIEVIAEVACRDMAHFFEAGYAALFLYSEETNRLHLHRVFPEEVEQEDLPLEQEDVMTVHMLKTRRDPTVIKDLAHYEVMTGKSFRRIPAEAPLAQGGLMCPLVVGMHDEEKITIGASLFGRKQGGFTLHDTEMATMLSEMVATSISTAQLIEKMSRLAETDGLTGVNNHRFFQQELDRAVATARRYGHPLSLAMIDIDYFKGFNDTYGHQAGDAVLREVARMIRQAVREKVDFVARYGGEEFAIIMPSTPEDGAQICLERLRETIATTPLSLIHI